MPAAMASQTVWPRNRVPSRSKAASFTRRSSHPTRDPATGAQVGPLRTATASVPRPRIAYARICRSAPPCASVSRMSLRSLRMWATGSR